MSDLSLYQALQPEFTALREAIMAINDTLTAIADQLDKAKGEILELVGQLRDGQADPTLVDRLEAVAQSFDDVVPDQPEEPAEPPVEPAEPPA